MILENDRNYVWHPYSRQQTDEWDAVLPVVGAKGATLTLENGKTLIDAISSWWTTIHGHGHPRLVQAIADQAATLDHVLFAGFTHEPAATLARRVITLANTRGAAFSKCFFSDNGSTAVEVALKLSFQSHRNRGIQTRNRFIAFRGAFHGDTLGAMSVCEPEGYHSVFRPLFAGVDFLSWESPRLLEDLDELLGDGADHSAVILEPLVQGAAGMKFVSPEKIDHVVQQCKQLGVHVIFDEVFTGFYRTGKLFAFEHLQSRPDFICLSKALTGGMLPLALTLCTQPIHDAFRSSDPQAAFLHGHTYTANPIACRVACESLSMLEELVAEKNQLANLEHELEKLREALEKSGKFIHVRRQGMIVAAETKKRLAYGTSQTVILRKKAIELGVLLRPMGSTLYTTPPYCTNAQQISAIQNALLELAAG